MSFTTLVDAPTLARHLGDPTWRVFDVRHQLADVAYGERATPLATSPGAFFLHCDRDLRPGDRPERPSLVRPRRPGGLAWRLRRRTRHQVVATTTPRA